VLLGAHYYTVCNGLTNQLLGHAGNIATAIARKMPVMVPDVFIVDGVQWANQRGVYSNAKAVMDNSIPFSGVFNTSALLETIRSFGVEAAVASYEESLDSPLDCTFLEPLRGGDPAVIREILRVMAASPSAGAAAVVEEIMAALFAAAAEAQPWVSKETGVCLHHRDGADWHSHCDNWEPLPNSARNCHGRDRPLSELVQHRTSHIHGRWFLYAGDHDIPADLQSLGAPVLTREEVFDSSRHDLVARFTNKQFASVPRDLRAVLDYLTCFRLPYFIGNSVSTFSCGQILQRESNASWYNSGFIPLSEILQAYLLPIVYTFTEEGSAQRKSMLKVSILSVRRHMPAAAVYVLYHGSRDVGFRAWLVRQGVRLRDHRPPWRDKVERLRLAGQGPAGGPAVDGGDFFGRWQHIDIPFHVSVEYCLLLDASVLLARPFTIAYFGKGITPTLAFPREDGDREAVEPSAGVALLNVPFLRETQAQLLSFVFDTPSASDAVGGWASSQGAYRSFYKSDVHALPASFSLAAWSQDRSAWKDNVLIQFEGMEPIEIIQHWFGGSRGDTKDHLLRGISSAPFLCMSLQIFAKAAVSEYTSADDDGLIDTYCGSSLGNMSVHIKALCSDFLTVLAGLEMQEPKSCTAHLQAVILKRNLILADFPNIV